MRNFCSITITLEQLTEYSNKFKISKKKLNKFYYILKII